MKYITKGMFCHQYGAWLLLKIASQKLPKGWAAFWLPHCSPVVSQTIILMQYSERAHKN
jgi:hypothetical protein